MAFGVKPLQSIDLAVKGVHSTLEFSQDGEELLLEIKVHLRFHISLLMPFKKDILWPNRK
jgi:hypothetical protein